MDLQNQTTSQSRFAERSINSDQRDLEDVGCQSLNCRVHRLTFTGLTNPEVGVFKFGYATTSAKECFGVAPSFCLSNGAIHIRLNVRKGYEVRIKYFGRLVGTDTETLTKTKRFHSVGESVRNHFGFRTLFISDVTL